MKQRRRGFTLIEMSVVLSVVVMLIAMLAPILSQSSESDNRAACRANVKVIATAMKIYANENEEWWPTPAFDGGALGFDPDIRYSGQVMPQGNCESLSNCADPTRLQESTTDWTALSVTRAYWMLVRSGETEAKRFICPSSDDVAVLNEDIDLFYDFFSMNNISYGYQIPFGPRETRASENIDPRMPLGGDHGPYSVSDQMPDPPKDFHPGTDPSLWQPFNSPNHRGTAIRSGFGQNVLFQDGHVSFVRTPLAGIDGGNIYTHMSDNASRVGRYVGTHPANGPPRDAFPGQDTFGNRHANTDSLIWP